MKYLIVGLGNVGPEYENTRHNIGFKVLDAFAEASNFSFELARHAYYGEHKIKNRYLYCIKPTTLVNLSGKAVRYWMHELNIPPQQILIITDDLALPLGKIRLKKKGGDGGHNGLKNIIDTIQTQDFPRLRIGIGDEFARGKQVDHVLGKWSDEELNTLKAPITNAVAAIKDFAFQGIDKTMSTYNG